MGRANRKQGTDYKYTHTFLAGKLGGKAHIRDCTSNINDVDYEDIDWTQVTGTCEHIISP
jgi:hypothetical protein